MSLYLEPCGLQSEIEFSKHGEFEIGTASKDLSSANKCGMAAYMFLSRIGSAQELLKKPRHHMKGVTWALLVAGSEAVIQEQGVHLGDKRSNRMGR